MNKLNSFMMLQYIESSIESHFMVVPNNPNMPDPKIPPPHCMLLFAIIVVLVMHSYDK